MFNATGSVPKHVVLTPDNHAANLWVVTLLCLSLSSLSLLARGIAKWRFGLRRTADDYVLAGVFPLIVLQHGLVMVALTKHLGMTLSMVDSSQLRQMKIYFYASQVVLVIASYFPKIAMIILLRRVFNFPRGLVYGHCIFVAAGIGAVLAVSAGCNPDPGPITTNSESTCKDRLVRWSVVTAVDTITEITIIAIAIYYLRDVIMWRVDKAKVLFAISTRSLCIVCSALFIFTYSNFLKSANSGTAIITPSILQQCNLSASVSIASILPCFRLLFQSSEMSDYPPNMYQRAALAQRAARENPRNRMISANNMESNQPEPVSPTRSKSSSTGATSEVSKTRTVTF